MIRIDRRALLAAWAALPLMGCAVAGDGGPADPLPSWNGGPAKTAIVEFVEAVTTEGGVDYVPPDARIATFDNDGTLWAEQPIYFQFAFALDRIKALAPQHPEWQDTQPFKAVLEGDPQALAASGEKGLLEIIAATHAGMTTDEFSATVADWLATARHPRFDRPYTELVYQPMLELLAYLRESGFKTFIVSGGGVEFMRVFAERVYGIPPEQVVGSSGVVRLETGPDGRPVLKKEGRSNSSTTAPASRSASTGSSGAARSWPSAIPTGICRCCNGRPRATAPGSGSSCTTPTPSANGPMTATPMSASSTRRSTKPTQTGGRWST
jgi:phosphoglycolate phosphatase-like HAD superfamily hydrolase